MSDELNKLIKEYDQLLNQQIFNPEDLNYDFLNYHITILKQIDVVDSGCISVYDMYKRNHVYYSPKYATLLGWNSERAHNDIEYTNSLIHPDDILQLYRAGNYYVSLGFSFEDKRQSKEYKAIFEYRVKGRDGQLIRVVEQHVPLEFDKSGNIWLALSMLDISPDNDLNAPFRGRLMNQRTGELFYFPPDEFQDKPINLLTSREREILKLISKGLISKQIADKLFISVNTVNTHRQRIIEKLNVSNTYEAIQYGHNNGLFNNF